MYVTSIFKRHIRNKAAAWKPLGYNPIERKYYSSSQWDNMKPETKSLRFNLLFDTVLQSFRKAQEENALIIPLTLGNETRTGTFKFLLLLSLEIYKVVMAFVVDLLIIILMPEEYAECAMQHQKHMILKK